MTYHLAYTPPLPETWRTRAACAGRSDIFDPPSGATPDTTATAQRICARCPVSAPCLSSALSDEGTAPAYARVGVRGGLTTVERAQRAGAAIELEEPESYDEVDRLLRTASMTDKEIALRVGFATVTVHRRRRALGLPAHRPHGATVEQAFALGVRTVEGSDHVVWRSATTTLIFNDQNLTVTRLAFRLGHGREADGPVRRSCEHSGCIAWQHLTDNRIREESRRLLGTAA
ncbi:WhiB family transcriptional regulator [Streptomyces erythrochromogenes]|uniref:WhiB family transcriptional regulator n=1 Tax=Streptomyces erythrochromogenes TaxID=285574 RepID=UPI00224D09F3|nr:WhiB family transcriptional regulator [Streptomyces erythrochromogenes]MCX5587597.1 WhiB family transcriptional regulator [Streptomyces erythrochromogenes]